jgi:hypothetical protein
VGAAVAEIPNSMRRTAYQLPARCLERTGVGMSERDGPQVFVGLSVCRDPYGAETDRQRQAVVGPCPVAWERTDNNQTRDESERMCETNPMASWVNCADCAGSMLGRSRRNGLCETNPMVV